MNGSRTRIIEDSTRELLDGAERQSLVRDAQIVWAIHPENEISEPCIELEKFMDKAARDAADALDVMKRITGKGGQTDHHLLTALKKYVQDTCEAIKVIDNTLRKRGTGLEEVLFEVPDESGRDEMSWRNLIGRRDVIAHNLLNVDDKRVHLESQRDFGALHRLISKVYFAPIRTDWANQVGITPQIRTELIKSLSTSVPGNAPILGQSLVFVCDDKSGDYRGIRVGRTEDNQLLFALSDQSYGLKFSVRGIGVAGQRGPELSGQL